MLNHCKIRLWRCQNDIFHLISISSSLYIRLLSTYCSSISNVNPTSASIMIFSDSALQISNGKTSQNSIYLSFILWYHILNVSHIQESIQYLPGNRCPCRSFYSPMEHKNSEPLSYGLFYKKSSKNSLLKKFIEFC